ncbi:methylamine utilization protein [Methylobacterium sp. J-026]|uniref:methylamine utilization protein n=1 Tax=Methylobacterium sp. J-026 TaxID=2836624 RepID=UPI001FB8B54A|nr:methylamine utilization protein [Methylobacterium sp. J-026]MCJ2136189.1 methylamine utilization protein [Methylobacterium sp. J-026]
MSNKNRKLLPLMMAGSEDSLASARGTIARPPHADDIVSPKSHRVALVEVDLPVGATSTVVNDDDNFVHQAYVEAETFAFDSGDIEPGAKAVITFPTEGDFTVLCGVHPKMKLAVHVR